MKHGNRTLELNRLPPVHNFTPREKEIWDLYQQGKKVKEIAEILNMKETSVSRRLFTAKEKVYLI